MNAYAWVLLGATAVAAFADWYAVVAARRDIEQVAKPAVPALLAAFALLLHADQTTGGRWVLVALAFALLGDVLLMSRTDRALGAGLVGFLCAHVAFIGALLSLPRSVPVWVGVVVSGLAVLSVVVALVPMARRDPVDGTPPLAYALVIGVFVTLAWWSGHLLVAVGASLFVVSDALLAGSRLWKDWPRSALAVMVTYHLALVLLVTGLLRPDLGTR